MMVKICGITNSEDALAAVGGGAAALGFNFFGRSPRYIAPRDAAKLAATVPPNVWKVGVFVDETPEEVLRIAAEAGLDVAQLHGNEPPDRYPPGMRVWKAIRVGPEFQIPGPAPAEAVLLDGPASGQVFDWAHLPSGLQKIILAGGLHAGNVRQAIEQAHPWGVDACSQIESSPGRKDHAKMAAFLKAAMAGAQ